MDGLGYVCLTDIKSIGEFYH